ncbi:MAG: hypothetical protein H0V44_05620 [Planctomycetes bacterium]|nr:hypothetical protein [Planctomycetota bacterium]
MNISPENLVLIVLISSRHVTATVAALHAEHGDKVVAHKSIDCQWYDLSNRGRLEILADVVRLASDSAGIEPWSVYLSCNDTSLASRIAVGWASPGEEMPLTEIERAWALRRAREQATGADREVVDVLPVQWTVRGRDGEHEVDDPIGSHGNHLTCQALLLTARRGFRDELTQLARGIGLDLDGIIPQPLALYRGMSGKLRSRGSSLVIDFGARHTSFLVRRKDKLMHVETFGFGGDHLTTRISEGLGLEAEQAEALKRDVDIGQTALASDGFQGQQFIWTDIQERHALLAPATRICAEAIAAFFKERARDLRDHGYLAQQGQIHLVGRASSLGGLSLHLREIFDLPVMLGTGDKNRHPGDELDGLLTTGLVCSAADHRRAHLASHAGSLSKRASGVWSWLTHALT